MFHVTARENIPSIKVHGLLPGKDRRGAGFADEPPAVYLFRTLEDLEDGVTNWLGECFPEDTELVALEVSLPPGVTTVEDPELPLAACRVFVPVAPEHLKILSTAL